MTTTKRKKKKSVKLPDKPSALILLAVRDMKKVKRDRRYRIDMDNWHNPNGKCAVCCAGAVMAFSLHAPRNKRMWPADFDAATTRKLLALNNFRSGYVRIGLREMGIDRPDIDYFFEVADEGKFMTFCRDMLKMAKLLKEHGL